MNSISSNLNLMIKSCEKVSKVLIRDFGEVEKLQVSIKGPKNFVTNSDRKVEDMLVNELSKSKKLIRHAIKDGANYIAIGAFFKSKTKKINYIAKPSLISWAKRFTKLPVVIIGGITNKNFRKLLLHKPDFLAISGGIWDKKPTKAIKEFL